MILETWHLVFSSLCSLSVSVLGFSSCATIHCSIALDAIAQDSPTNAIRCAIAELRLTFDCTRNLHTHTNRNKEKWLCNAANCWSSNQCCLLIKILEMNSKLITTFNLTVSRHRIHHLNCSIFMCALQIVLHVYALNAGLCIALLSLEIVRRDFSRFHFQHEKSFNFCNRKHFQLYIPIVAFSRRTWAWAYNAQQMARWFYRSFAIFFSLPRSFFCQKSEL